jgi:NMD protein affecting ribosome stability and mRNA decay
MKCPKCGSERTFQALVDTTCMLLDGRNYRGPILLCRDCNAAYGRGMRPLDELMEENKRKRKARPVNR